MFMNLLIWTSETAINNILKSRYRSLQVDLNVYEPFDLD